MIREQRREITEVVIGAVDSGDNRSSLPRRGATSALEQRREHITRRCPGVARGCGRRRYGGRRSHAALWMNVQSAPELSTPSPHGPQAHPHKWWKRPRGCPQASRPIHRMVHGDGGRAGGVGGVLERGRDEMSTARESVENAVHDVDELVDKHSYGTVISISVWQTAQEADAATQSAAQRVRANLASMVQIQQNDAGDVGFFATAGQLGA